MAADPQNRDLRSTETPDAATADLDLRPVSAQIDALLTGDAAVVPAVARAAPALGEAIETITGRLRSGGRLYYVGAGSAGRTAALDAAEIGPTFGVSPSFVRAVVAGGLDTLTDADEGLEDDAEAGVTDLQAARFGVSDALIAVSASGRTPYTVAAARHAASLGAYTVAVVSNPDSTLADVCTTTIEVLTGPEAIAGSTRLRAGTAQKIVLNTISTLVMVGLGRTYGNRMVAVRQDNDKLRARAQQALADLADTTREQAADALAAVDDAPTALVVLLTGADATTARRVLERHDGRVREAVREITG